MAFFEFLEIQRRDIKKDIMPHRMKYTKHRRKITNSDYNRREPKVSTNPYICIFKNHVGLILCVVLYFYTVYFNIRKQCL